MSFESPRLPGCEQISFPVPPGWEIVSHCLTFEPNQEASKPLIATLLLEFRKPPNQLFANSEGSSLLLQDIPIDFVPVIEKPCS